MHSMVCKILFGASDRFLLCCRKNKHWNIRGDGTVVLNLFGSKDSDALGESGEALAPNYYNDTLFLHNEASLTSFGDSQLKRHYRTVLIALTSAYSMSQSRATGYGLAKIHIPTRSPM